MIGDSSGILSYSNCAYFSTLQIFQQGLKENTYSSSVNRCLPQTNKMD